MQSSVVSGVFASGSGRSVSAAEAEAGAHRLRMAVLARVHRRAFDTHHDWATRLAASEVFFGERMALWRTSHAAGQTPGLLRAELLRVCAAFANWRFLAAREGVKGLPGFLSDPRHHHDVVQLFSLCRLFGLKRQLAAWARLLPDTPGADRLLATLATGRRIAPRDVPLAYPCLHLALDARTPARAWHWIAVYCNAATPESGQGHDEGKTWHYEAAALLATLWPEAVAEAATAPGHRRTVMSPGFPADLLTLMFHAWQDLTPSASVAQRFRRRLSTHGQVRRASLVATLGLAVACQPPSVALAAGPEPGDVERGVASWYGPGFQDRTTANGERYDMHLFTAAHRSLPLPSFVHVRNLRNDREVVVVVNDRGPYVEGRTLDLSYGAALQLGMVQPGVVEVEMRLVSPQQIEAWAADGGTAVRLDGPFTASGQDARDSAGLAGGLAALLQVGREHAEITRPDERPAGETAEVRTAFGTQNIAAFAGGLAQLVGEPVSARVASAQAPRLARLDQATPQASRMQPVKLVLAPRAGADGTQAIPVRVPVELLLALQQWPDADAKSDAHPAPSPDFMGGLRSLSAGVNEPVDKPMPRPDEGDATAAQAYPVRVASEYSHEILAPGAVPARHPKRRASATVQMAEARPPARGGLAALAATMAHANDMAASAAVKASTPPPAHSLDPAQPGLLDRLASLTQRSWRGLTGLLGMAKAGDAKPDPQGKRQRA